MYKYLKNLPFYENYIKKKLIRESEFYEKNRILVLDTYRFLIKNIPKIYPRPLQQHQKLNELRWIYKTGKSLPNIYETEGRTNLAVKTVEEIKRGDISRLGDFVPRYNQTQRTDMEIFLQEKLQSKNQWWRGYIY